ncbi:hypothetical protein AB4452_04615 [Vibrio lentus]
MLDNQKMAALFEELNQVITDTEGTNPALYNGGSSKDTEVDAATREQFDKRLSNVLEAMADTHRGANDFKSSASTGHTPTPSNSSFGSWKG